MAERDPKRFGGVFAWLRRHLPERWQDRLRLHYGEEHRRRVAAYEERFRHVTVRLSSPVYRARVALLRWLHRFRVKAALAFSFLSSFLFPALGVFLICGALWFASRYTLGLSVVVDDRVIGYVTDSEEYRRISAAVETAVKDESVASTGQELYLVEQFPVLRFAVIPKEEVTPEEDLYEALYTMASDYTRQSYGLFLDGILLATSKNAAEPERVLNKILEYYEIYGEDDNLEILNNVEIIRGEYPSSYEMGYSRILSLFRYSDAVQFYTVRRGDTAASVAERFGLSVPVFRLINSIAPGKEISAGQTVRVDTPRYSLTVKNTQTVTETESIPCETEYIYSDELYEGSRKTVFSGSNGLRETVSDVIYINNAVTSSVLVSSVQLKEPVTRVVKVGTKPIAPSGRFIFPLKTYQFVSSGFGWRWLRGVRDFHRGLDIAAAAGTPIYAADAGTVTRFGWDKSLGYYVRIDHGNGIETVYGHCSAIASSIHSGKKVYQGELLAYVGKTGNATGNHLHFGVYQIATGSYLNPADYLHI